MKNFDTWNSLKKEIHEKKTTPLFSEGEIWWTHFGLNVGYELDGKHDHFERPICIYKKHNENHFLAIPVTSSENKAPWITELQHG